MGRRGGIHYRGPNSIWSQKGGYKEQAGRRLLDSLGKRYQKGCFPLVAILVSMVVVTIALAKRILR